jgi:hypothetical protein
LLILGVTVFTLNGVQHVVTCSAKTSLRARVKSREIGPRKGYPRQTLTCFFLSEPPKVFQNNLGNNWGDCVVNAKRKPAKSRKAAGMEQGKLTFHAVLVRSNVCDPTENPRHRFDSNEYAVEDEKVRQERHLLYGQFVSAFLYTLLCIRRSRQEITRPNNDRQQQRSSGRGARENMHSEAWGVVIRGKYYRHTQCDDEIGKNCCNNSSKGFDSVQKRELQENEEEETVACCGSGGIR